MRAASASIVALLVMSAPALAECRGAYLGTSLALSFMAEGEMLGEPVAGTGDMLSCTYEVDKPREIAAIWCDPDNAEETAVFFDFDGHGNAGSLQFRDETFRRDCGEQ